MKLLIGHGHHFSLLKSKVKYFVAEGLVAVMIKPGQNLTHLRFYAHPGYLQVWRREVLIKTEGAMARCFPHFMFMGPFCCHCNHSFEAIYSKSICSQSPILTILQIKFDQD